MVVTVSLEAIHPKNVLVRAVFSQPVTNIDASNFFVDTGGLDVTGHVLPLPGTVTTDWVLNITVARVNLYTEMIVIVDEYQTVPPNQMSNNVTVYTLGKDYESCLEYFICASEAECIEGRPSMTAHFTTGWVRQRRHTPLCLRARFYSAMQSRRRAQVEHRSVNATIDGMDYTASTSLLDAGIDGFDVFCGWLTYQLDVVRSAPSCATAPAVSEKTSVAALDIQGDNVPVAGLDLPQGTPLKVRVWPGRRRWVAFLTPNCPVSVTARSGARLGAKHAWRGSCRMQQGLHRG